MRPDRPLRPLSLAAAMGRLPPLRDTLSDVRNGRLHSLRAPRAVRDRRIDSWWLGGRALEVREVVKALEEATTRH